MTIEKALEELGLGKTKGTVYLAALEVGSGSVQEIAERARLPRTTVHEIVHQLTALGLISRSVSGRRTVYTAESPKALENLLKEKERTLADILPELNSRLNTGKERPRVRYYDGVAGVRAIFEDTLTVSTPLLCGILSIGNLYELAGHEFMDAYVPRRIKAGIQLNVVRSHTTDVIGAKGELWPTSKEELRELRYAPSTFHFAMTMYFYDNKVAVIGTKQEPFGMIIESQEFYRTQKQLFELLWNTSSAKTPKREVVAHEPARKLVVLDQIYALLTKSRYNRDEPLLQSSLRDLIEGSVAENKPIKLVGFWGAGPKSAPNWADTTSCEFLDKLNKEIKAVYAPGIEFHFIFATQHGLHNGYDQGVITSYVDGIKKLFKKFNFHSHSLDGLWKKYGINFEEIEHRLEQKPAGWWERVENREFIEHNAAERNKRLPARIAAQKYFVMRDLEKAMLEQEFRGYIFHAFSDSQLRNVLPHMPTLYFYARDGRSNAPWFVTEKQA